MTYHINALKQYESVVITYLTEKEERQIDEGLEDGDFLILRRGEQVFKLFPNRIYAYGDIDFSTNSNDYKELATFAWLDHYGFKGKPIPAKYNYDKHICLGTSKGYLHTETYKSEVLAQYCHGCLGKPKRTVIFLDIK